MTHLVRLTRMRKNGVPEDRNGISVNSRINSSDMSKMELLSPNVQMKGSVSCMVVLWDTAKVTALLDSRKLNINAKAKVTIMRGLCCHWRKL